jgi:hypothetical protein
LSFIIGITLVISCGPKPDKGGTLKTRSFFYGCA